MRLHLHLAGTHPTLPRAELDATLAACGLPWQPQEQTGRVITGETSLPGDGEDPRLLHALGRLGLVHEASLALLRAPRDEEGLLQQARAHPEAVQDAQGVGLRFMVRAEYTEPGLEGHGPGRQTVERVLGQAWSSTAQVDLQRPERILRAWLTPDQVLVGRRLWTNDRAGFQARAPKHRPYFSPVSGHPVIMRAISNLAQVPPGGILYDPLVGTGGILLEAGLAGMQVVGSDNDPAMVQGTRENLNRYNVQDNVLFVCDVREAHERFLLSTGRPQADGIVTDLPYGQSSTTGGAAPAEVAHWTLEAAARLLPRGRRLVVGTPQPEWLAPAEAMGFVPDGRYDVRVHKSLTRSYLVFLRR